MFGGLLASSMATVPSVALNNGLVMPMISLGTWQYNDSVAESVVKLGLSLGYNHIDTANNYKNQEGVGAALAGVNRSTYFLTTKVPPQLLKLTSYKGTMKDLEENLSLLKLSYVDLVLLHYPPMTQSCGAMQEAWRAMEDFYAQGKVRCRLPGISGCHRVPRPFLQ